MTTQSMCSGATRSNGICGDCRVVACGRRKGFSTFDAAAKSARTSQPHMVGLPCIDQLRATLDRCAERVSALHSRLDALEEEGGDRGPGRDRLRAQVLQTGENSYVLTPGLDGNRKPRFSAIAVFGFC
jgi:hypothetical protein